jgi:thiamine transport system substrate-binding protein
MQRRRFLRRAGASGVALLAGCSAERVEDGGDGGSGTNTTETTTTTTGEDTTTTTTGDGDGTTTAESTPTLTVATYPAFVDAPSTSPGPWLKEEFESRFDATLEWAAPEGELNHYIQRKTQGAPIEADVYAGLVPMDMVRVDQKLSGDRTLFQPTDPSGLSNADRVDDRYYFDAENRAIPFDASFVSFVYDETAVDAPRTYRDLTSPAYEDALLLPNPQSAITGKMFLLMTIHRFGADGYLDYWAELADNGLHVLGSWSDAYAAYSNGEAPIVVSYSTDQVYAARNDQDMSRHQIAFPNDQGYAYVDGAARFADTDRPELGRTFIEFLLQPDVQAEISQRNVALPVVDNATLPPDYEELVHRPAEPVSFDEERLAKNLDTWVDEWSRQIAGN